MQPLFRLKTIAFLIGSCLFVALSAQAQVTDTIYQKPSLNNGMPPVQQDVPVIIKEPEKPEKIKETVKVKNEQEKEKEFKEPIPFRDRFFTGGGFGLSFGDYTNVQLAPILGFKITDWFAGGLGLTYIYIGNRYYSDTFLGRKVFLQGMVYKGFFAHVEYERFSSFSSDQPDVDATLGGAGYRQMISNKVGLDAMLLLNLNNNARAAYAEPWVYRFGFYIEI